MTSTMETARVTGDGKIRSEGVAVKFGRNLFRCRRRAAMSQEELGKLASLHRTEIGLLEHGGRVPRIDTLMKLAASLAVSPAELLEGIHWVPGESAKGSFAISEPTHPYRHRGDSC
jgi:transcriptional regulator with XRE-family HTH domain